MRNPTTSGRTSWPDTAERGPAGDLRIGGVPLAELARELGTPLYVYDETTLRARAREIRDTFAAAYPHSRVVYAGKAGISPAIVGILAEEGLGLDVVSGGEIYAGLQSGMNPRVMIFHGNNKGWAELREALLAEVGLIAVDSLHEIGLLEEVARELGRSPDVVLRLNPGVDPHTHHKMRTGATDSKFGFPIWDGQAAEAAARVARSPELCLAGYHAHVGSQIFDAQLVAQTVAEMMTFATAVFQEHGVAPRVVIPGGGFGVADDASGADVSIVDWAKAAATALSTAASHGGYHAPELVVEPGRAIVGPAGIAIYEVGSRKVIEGARTYVSVDGGMSDNIRPSLYGARYSADLVNRDGTGQPPETVTIAGKYCESGDVLIDSIRLPELRAGDLLALPMAGAYCLAMSSNYNLAPRPAVAVVNDGTWRLIRRRETYADMLQCEIFDSPHARQR
ncbi:MAG: diaminopimelate decarboxylase [Thermomicrobiales bacterium]|nr:diaminopimelate decarboxylase [Thermomicrobiales bacterium]